MNAKVFCTVLSFAAVWFSTLSAAGREMLWSGPANGDWFEGVNWTPNGIPGEENDHVTLAAGGSILLTNETLNLASFTMTGGTLVFSNWNTRLRADTIEISGGTVTLPAAFTDSQMSNRVWFTGVTFDLGGTAAINVDGRGWQGGGVESSAGYGPGGGTYGTAGAGGGGHGGAGNMGNNGGSGSVNGIVDNPGPGSGGGRQTTAQVGGHGGGAVRIEMTGAITLNGTITANGSDGNNGDANSRGGGGSGGGVVINGLTLSGAGLIRANGGYGGRYGGSGGGGRIALLVDHTAQSALPKHRLLLSAGSKTGLWRLPGDIGTLSASSPAGIDPAWLPHTVSLFLTGESNWNVNTLHVTNGWIRIADPSFTLTAGTGILVEGSKGHLEFYGSRLESGADLVVTNGGTLSVYSAATNSAPESPDYGCLVEVAGAMHVAGGSWVRPYSHLYNGGSALFRMGSLNVAFNGGFSADSAGFSRGITTTGDKNGYGPGKAASAWDDGGGAGYGGLGGRSKGSTVRGSFYGDPLRPVYAGSGGASAGRAAGRQGGNGGGSIRLEIDSRMVLAGTLSANGSVGIDTGGGGGSGGSIFVQCRSFSITESATLSARGGNGNNADAGGGGGGRIAIWYGAQVEGEINYNALEIEPDSAVLSATVSLAGGTGYVTDGAGEPGSFRLVRVLNTAATILLLR